MSNLLTAIEQVVGKNGLITGDDVRQRPADWRGQTSVKASAIVRPRSTEEVSQILKLCSQNNQPIVIAGGLTGLVHGADANAEEILISVERMTSIEKIDPIGRTMIVQAGAQLQKIQEAASEAGLLYAVDLGARGSATIGGNISTNAGGNQVLRYGMTREQVLGLEAVLADGTIISSMNTLLKNNSGYDLKQLFIGTEGTLGVVTRAVLKLMPQPHEARTALLACDTFNAVTAVFRQLGESYGAALTSFEVMWDDFYRLIAVKSGRHQSPVTPDAQFYVIVEANMGDENRFNEVLGEAIESGLVTDAAIASSSAQRNAIWAIRDDIEALMSAMMPGAVFDVSLPITKMEKYAHDISAAIEAAWDGAGRTVIFGHIGDGNLHVIVSAPDWSAEKVKQTEAIVYEPLAKIGGAISAEHGIGLEKRDYLALSRTPEEIALMRMLKKALDPGGLLNRGKIFVA
jgi:FAD/FMN-containing dehydrogenase